MHLLTLACLPVTAAIAAVIHHKRRSEVKDVSKWCVLIINLNGDKLHNGLVLR